MQGNGHQQPEVNSFEWLFSRRIITLEAEGIPGDDIDSLKSRGRQISNALNTFRTTRRALATGGKYTARGLQEALAEHASTAAGSIRRSQDMTLLSEDLRRTEAKLAKAEKADPMAELLKFWKQMELRATFERVNPLTYLDATTREIRGDVTKGNALYAEAMRTGDVFSQEALEQWPGVSVVSPELVQRGQAQRLAQVDPVNAKRLTDLRRYKETLEISVSDALQELKEFLPVADPIKELAGLREPEPPDEAA